MNESQIERAAYIAAHRILDADITAGEFACSGARRPLALDTIAGIIKDIFQSELTPDWESADCQQHKADSGPVLVPRRHTAVLIEFPRRAVF
jgi:hypothetical protein